MFRLTAGKVKGRHRIPVIHLLEIRKLTPGLHITRTRSPSLTLTAAMALTSPAPRSERQPRKQHQALTGCLGAPIRPTDAQTIELSAGTTYCTSIAGDAPALVLLRG